MKTAKFNSEPIKLQIRNDFKVIQEPLGFLSISLIILLIASFWEPAIYGLGIILVPIIFWIAKGGIGTSLSAFFRILFNWIRIMIKH